VKQNVATYVFLAAISSVSFAQDPKSAAQPLKDPTYRLGAGDEINVAVGDAAELKDLFGRSFQVGNDGYLSIPMAGPVQAAGHTLPDVEKSIATGLKKYIREPNVSISLKSIKSAPVSVIGAVNNPGVHQLEGPKTVAEVLALAGGLSKEAGYRLTVTRERKWGEIPLPNARWDTSGQFSTAELDTAYLTNAALPTYNIQVRPNDVIAVPRAKVVYVIGDVKKPGGFTLGEEKTISVLQALSLAEGITPTGSLGKARILREVAQNSKREEMPVDLKKLMAGKAPDVSLQANDILVVPGRATKKIASKLAESAIQTISGLIIWRGL
jgi:polysaccharide biosynthesis/export protein